MTSKLRTATHAQPSSLQAQLLERTPEARAQSQIETSDPLAAIVARSGGATGAGGHAATLNRATASRPARAGSVLLHLQRQYGNRHVQRVLEIARQGDGDVAPDVEQTIKQARGGGRALDSRVREQMEPAFGSGFGGVRVHTDERADSLNRSLNARAFATGQDIFFREGAYNPGTSGGRELLAHELTHVVQQTGGRQLQPKLTVSQPGDRFEREADQVAHEVMQQEQRPVQSAAPATGVGRQAEEDKEGAVQTRQQDEESLRTGRAGRLVQRQGEEDKDELAGRVQAKEAKPAAKAEEAAAPGVVDLKGISTYDGMPAEVGAWLDSRARQTGDVNVRFGGKTSATSVRMRKTAKGIQLAEKAAIPLNHPLFAGMTEGAAELQPSLVLQEGEAVAGYLGLRAGKRLPTLEGKLQDLPELVGLSGLKLPSAPKLTNKIEGGALVLAGTISFQLGRVFKNGSISIQADDEQVTRLEGGVEAQVQGLGSAQLKMAREEDGVVHGEGTADVKLTAQIAGKAKVVWTGETVTGEGTVDYKGEKLSGQVIVKVLERSEATQLEQQKKPQEEGKSGKPAKKAGKEKAKSNDYVVFGEGTLTFNFTDWLNGDAQVILDPKGNVTVITKIMPKKQVDLFDPPQKDYSKDLFSAQATAGYGIPVVGRIGIFGKVDLDAFAKLGPAKLKDIVVDGEYSTDPTKMNNFKISGTLNISAAAGLRLRGEAGAVAEILAHDIKAGAGINGIAGIRGYAEARPVIGYREKAAEGQDKKGEFFISGNVEIAAQPFLTLSGDLFVEVDAPWWSPVPDKKWTWPLGDKTWPIGGTFGINASVDYVFGSGQMPAIDFKPVEFSGDKFLTDLYSDKVKASGEKAVEKAGEWKEKNSRAAEPPKGEAKGNADPTKAPAKPEAQPTVQPGGGKKAVKPADPDAKTAEGKSVKEYQEEARQKGGKPSGKEPKAGAAKESEAASKGGQEAEKTKAMDLAGAKGKVQDALRSQLPNGAAQLEEVNKVLSGIASTVKPALANLQAEEVLPGRPKKEGAIGFKVTGETPDGKRTALAPVHYSKTGGVLSHEERWQMGVKGVERAIKQFEKRGISAETILMQLPKWEAELGFKTLRLDVTQTPWVILGSMSDENQVTQVSGTAKVPTGLNPSNAIPITWFKSLDLYVESIDLPNLGITIKREDPTRIPVGLEPGQKITLGVPNKYWPKRGKTMQYLPTDRGNAVAQIRAVLQYYGFKQRELMVQIDHVQDLQFGGPDSPENMWPYDSSANMSAGPRQRDQVVTYLDEKTKLPKQARTNELPGRWFIIVDIE